jgi:DNA polymerase-2
MKEKAFIIDQTYSINEEQTQIELYGKLDSKQSFLAIFPFNPYFYILESDQKKVSKYLKNFKVEKTSLTNFQSKKVIKISHSSHLELNKLYKVIHKSIPTFEADLKPNQRFLLDKNILSTLEISYDDYQTSEKIDKIFHNPEISPINDYKPNLKIASIDTESSGNELYCLSIVSENYKKVFMLTQHNLPNVVSCSSEEECLEKFKSALFELDPDILTGWNFIDHDLQLLKDLFMKNRIPFDLGRDNSNPRIRIQSNFFRNSTASITGRQVLDSLNLIRDPFIKEAPTIKHANFSSYTLENVSQTLLSDGKLLKGKDRHKEIISLFETNSKKSHKKLADYNLKDSQLVYDILEKTKTIDLAVLRSSLTGLPLDRINGSIAAFDSLYIRKANSKNLVSPTLAYSEKQERIQGGYVQSTIPGIYDNVLVLDFKSLYPSIIKTFNIDPSSYLEKKEKNSIQSPNKAYFKNTQGILPEIISTLHSERELAKKESRELASYALKIMMNSFFGVLASPNCRYFNLDIANAITHFAQHIVKLTASEIEKKYSLPTIYSDTDSVFVSSGLDKEKANPLGFEIQDYINNFYQKYTKEEYGRESFLELEFEKQYLSMIIPKVRGKSSEGAKKRYAGLLEKDGKEKIEIIGLEAIRGDWTKAAQEFQIELLEKVFHKKEISKFIQSYISKLTQGKLDSKLVYRKSIRKSLDKYTKTTPPHVKAARKIPNSEKGLKSNIIEYYLTVDGPEPIQNLKHSIDYKHYIEKQIKPIAEQILVLFNKSFDDVISGNKQAKLF